MKTSYLIALLMAGAVICLFAEAGSVRPAPAPAAGTADAPSCPVPSGTLRIAHPCEGARLPFLSSTFVFGAADPAGTLTLNGKPVPVHPGGGFIAMVDLSTGAFTIRAELAVGTTTYAVTRTVTVAAAPAPCPGSPLTIESVQPDSDCELLPGEELTVSCTASPGKEASFTIERVKGSFPMAESPQAPGIYRGVYTAGANDRLNRSKIRVKLTDKKSRKKITAESRHTLSLFRRDAPVVAEITAERGILRAGPALSGGDRGAYLLFLPRGTNLRVTGRRGDELRVRLTGTRDAWITQGDVRLLPPGTPSPRATAGNVRVSGRERATEVRLPLGKRVPFEVVPDDEGKYIDVSFFGAVSNTDMAVYASTGGVEQVRWFQDDSDTYRLRVRPWPGRWWGYDARYEGNAFVLDLRSPPAVLRGTAPLAGITVAVDPGHSPDTGAVGPTGLAEKDANLALARCLKEKLQARGAAVVMTRDGADGAALYDRPKTAYRANADLLVSVHGNALPDGQNPFEKNGYGVYYYHPASLGLAREIHAAYGEAFGQGAPPDTALRDDGLYYDDLAIPRTTQMPAVLVESAYIIIPREEACLRSPAFLEKCADAITKGVERYVSAVCGREEPPAGKAAKRSPKRRKKA